MRVFGNTMERASWATCRHTGAWLGLMFWHAARKRQEIAARNVRLAFPNLSNAACRRIARRAAQNSIMTFCEFLHMNAASPQEMADYCDIEGFEHIQKALDGGRGALLVTAHFGNWEVMGSRVGQKIPMTVIARPRSNRGVDAHIEEVRRESGMSVISKYDSAREILGVLRKNGALGILPDQYAGENGLLLPLFGHLTRFEPAPARLALMGKAPIVPSFGIRREPWLADGRIVATMTGIHHLNGKDYDSREEATLAGTRLIIDELEKIVRAHPAQWLWMHRRWREEDEVGNA